MKWFLEAFKRYAVISGRSRRREYWYFTLFNMIFWSVASVADYLLGTAIGESSIGVFYCLYGLAVVVPEMAVAVRRLHDVGKSGWMMFIVFIPLVGIIWLIILLLKDSEKGENEYGNNPKEENEEEENPKHIIAQENQVVNQIENISTKGMNHLASLIREFDLKYVLEKSKNICVLDEINDEEIAFQIKYRGLVLDSDEKLLLILNKKMWVLNKQTSGFAITTKGIHFSLIRRLYFPVVREKPRKIKLEGIDSFQIGEHDSCYGTNYVGHDLMINNQKLGLVRLGYGLMYDDKALRYINELSKFLYQKGFLKEAPKEYSWQ